MERCVVCYTHEILLKRGNRNFFEKQLRDNVIRALAGLPYAAIRRLSGRLLVELLPESPVEEITTRLRKVFGLVYCCPAWRSRQDPERLEEDLWSLVEGRQFQTFRISARRASKQIPFPSMELNRRLGALVQTRSGRRVQLEDPDLTCHVDLVEDHAFLYFDRLPGACGLPLSSSGRVVVLMSGGIDSPVAAYKMMKRGCRVIFAHFHSLPHTTPESLEKVRRLVSLLNDYQYTSRVYMIPFAELQRQIVALTPASTRVILYRRMMVRLAARVARRERARALVTGDSIGQVSSQTLENIAVISAATTLPILRPLVGEDKEEIVALARRIGTFPISVEPDVDCCSLFVPRHPETRARLEAIRDKESRLEIDKMVDSAWSQRRIEKIGYSTGSEAVSMRV